MKLSTVLDTTGAIELRCGQCWINQQTSPTSYKPNLVGKLHRAGRHTLVFAEYERVADSGADEPRYPISYQPLTDNPQAIDWLLIGTQRGNEANLAAAGLLGSSRYDYTGRPARWVDRPARTGITAQCRRGHWLEVTAEQLSSILDQPPAFHSGTYLPPREFRS